MADKEIAAMDPDGAVEGAELIAVSDGGSAKKISVDDIYAYVKGEIEGITTLGAVDANDSVMMLENDTDLIPLTIELLQQYMADTMWSKGDEAAPDAADSLALLDSVGPTEKIVTLANIAALMLSTNRTSMIDTTTLDATGGVVDATQILISDGATTPRRCTALQLSAYVYAAVAAYVAALAAVGVGTADTDVFICWVGGVAKKVELSDIIAHFGGTPVVSAGVGVNNVIPQWSAADTLKAGVTLVDSFGAGSATAVPSTLGARTELGGLINDSVAMAADIVDADTLLIDDGAGGTQKKSIFSRVWTYILAKLLTFLAAGTTLFTIDTNAGDIDCGDIDCANIDCSGITLSDDITGTTGTVSIQVLTSDKKTWKTQQVGVISADALDVGDGGWWEIVGEGAASDDLTSFTNLTAGMEYIFMATDDTHTITFKHQANIFCEGAVDLALDSVTDMIRGFSPDGTKMICQLIHTA